jgi:sec-independent protein translocase protein TatA
LGLGELSPLHIVLVLAIALLVIGPGKLPEVGSAIGKSLREFRRASSGDDEPQVAVSVTAAPALAIGAPATPEVAAEAAEVAIAAPAVASASTEAAEQPAGA